MLILGYLCTNNIVHFMIYQTKRAHSFPFHLEGHAKIWYNTIPDAQKANFDNLITLFKKRFKDKQHLLDLTI